MNRLFRLPFPAPLALAGVALLLIGAALPVAADDDEAARTVTVSGSAELEVEPDQAVLRFGIEHQAAELQAAREHVAGVVARLLELCASLDIAERDVDSTAVNVRPVYRYDQQRGEQSLTGYQVQRDLTVTLRDIDKVGALAEGAIRAGANQASPPQFSLADESAAEQQVLAAAARDARRRADTLAATLGVKVGDVRRIVATGGQQMPPVLRAMPKRALAMEADAAGEETYSPGMLRMSAEVSVEFDLQP